MKPLKLELFLQFWQLVENETRMIDNFKARFATKSSVEMIASTVGMLNKETD